MIDSQLINDSRFEIETGEISLFDSLKYILGGDATFTLLSVISGTRFTYRCSQSVEYVDNKPVKKDMFFLNVLTGPNNQTDFKYACVIDKTNNPNFYTLRFTKKSNMTAEAPSMVAINAVLNILQSSVQHINSFRKKLKIYHDGTCSNCGRKLTDPISVAVGRGPICAAAEHKAYALGCKKRGIIIDKKGKKLIYPN